MIYLQRIAVYIYIYIYILRSKNIILSLKGVVDIDIRHPKIAYLRNALLVDEEMLSQLGIKVGILGHNRSDYDIMLMPYEPEEPEPTEIDLRDRKLRETRKSIFVPKILVREASCRSHRNTHLSWIHRKIESLIFLFLCLQRNKLRRSKACPK